MFTIWRLLVVATSLVTASTAKLNTTEPVPVPVPAPSTTTTTTSTTSTTTTTTMPPTTTTTLPATDCAEWYSTAIGAGWAVENWPRLSKIMFRESRCITDTFNATDPQGGSIGLLQINQFWCKPQRGAEQGWLQSQGVLSECEELKDPAVNLLAGWRIYSYAQSEHGDGWIPWRT